MWLTVALWGSTDLDAFNGHDRVVRALMEPSRGGGDIEVYSF